MGKLSDILRNGAGDSLRAAWTTTEAADDFALLPPGIYSARITAGELFTSRSNQTAGYKLTFKVLEGEHSGRLCWHDIWLTPAALPMAKRDLGKIGVSSLEQLEQPVPKGIRCSIKVAMRKSDDGTEFNAVKSFEVLGIDPPDLDPFAPAVAPSGPSPVSPRMEQGEADGGDSSADAIAF